MKLFSFIRRHISPLAVLCFVFGSLVVQPQSSFAQCPNGGPGPLCFGNNFFVTGDYVVGGANMSVNIANGFATGTITIPDANPGIQPGKTSTCTIDGVTKTNCVPAGADILAAILYWQTVEKIGVTPGQPGSGQNGFFGPVLNNVPQLYPIAGATNSQNTVSFSNGGCSGTSTGKVVKTYRADVRGYLPQDVNGNILANRTFEVMLPSSSNTTPISLGATLIIIYRVLSPNVPLNSIVIYDGAFAPGNNTLPPSTMTQIVQGFYDAAHDPLSRVSRLTHIAGQGKSKKFETVFLGPNPATLTQLKSPNGSDPPFPGFYGGWDNPTWTFPDPNHPEIGNPVQAGNASATTKIMADINQPGCPSWGAVIVSTTVQNTDNDGLLDVWKTNQGYCDASINEGSCTHGDPSTGWVALPGTAMPIAGTPHPDVFVQLDYMCGKVTGPGSCVPTSQPNVTQFSITLNVITVMANNSFSVGEIVQLQSPPQIPPVSYSYLDGVALTVSTVSAGQFTAAFTHADVPLTNVTGTTASGYSFNPFLAAAPGGNVAQKVIDAFANKGITLHVTPTNAIQEQICQDIPGQPPRLCSFPNQAGMVGWPGGFLYYQNQFIDPTTGNICAIPPAAGCVPVFQRGKKDSWHYALFAHALGLANWNFPSGQLTDSTGAVPGVVVQAANSNTVTFYTAHAHGLVANDHVNGNGRVNVAFANSNPNLNGTWFVSDVHCPVNPATNPPTGLGDCSLSNTAPGPYTFQIQIGSAVSTATSYTQQTDPNLVAGSGQADRVSGFSDIGGSHSLITLGNWRPEFQTWQAKAGTFMHELGHSLGLTHGGFYFDSLTSNNNNYTPTIEANCKPNHQSVMNYDFQIDLLDKFDPINNVLVRNNLDYSGQALNPPLVMGVLGLDKLNMSPNNSMTPFPWTTTPTYDNTAWHGTAAELGGGVVGSRLPSYCTGTPIPIGTDLFRIPLANSSTSSLFWEAHQDINLDGNTTTEAPLRGHDDWNGIGTNGLVTAPGIDMRQISATGSVTAAELVGGAGGYTPPEGGGGGFTPPAGGGGGYTPPAGGGGGFTPPAGGGGGYTPPAGGGGGYPAPSGLGGGGGYTPPEGGGGGLGEMTQQIANSFTRPPTNLTASEGASPRKITLNWTQPAFGAIIKYKIYRSDAGGPFNVIATLSGTPPATTFTDNPACNPGGYRYQVTAVATSNTGQDQESVGSNIVSKSGQTGVLLTACYTNTPTSVHLNDLSSPNMSFVQGDFVPITWSLQDDDTGKYVNIVSANTSLSAIGPIPHVGACPPTVPQPLPAGAAVMNLSTGSGITSTSGGILPTIAPNHFTFNWDTTNVNAGCWFFLLNTDSGQSETTGTAPNTKSPLMLDIFVSDSIPHVTTTSLPDATVGVFYNNTVYESGGTIGATAFSWTIVPGSVMPGAGSVLPGISFQPNAVGTFNGTLSGTPTVGGIFTFTARVMDSVGNFGTRVLTLRVIGFGPTGSLGKARLAHTATLLSTGKVLVAGGNDPLASAELYDPTTGTFSATGSMNAARSFHTATLLANGKVLIAGGQGTGGPLQTAEIYDPNTGMFTTTTGNMTRPRFSHTATVLGDGTVLMAGGFGVSDPTAEIFNPATGTFSLTTGNMTAVRISHTATLLTSGPKSGQVLLVGGADGSVSVGTLPTLASAELYDPATKMFTATSTSLTTSRENHTATLLGGSVYIIGGISVGATSSLQSSAEVFSASAPVPAFSVVSAALNSARSLHTATLLANGSVLIAGGIGSPSSAELFNSTVPSFTVTPSLATGRFFHTATLLNDGTVLVIGGESSGAGPALASAELYFPAPPAP